MSVECSMLAIGSERYEDGILQRRRITVLRRRITVLPQHGRRTSAW